MTQLALPGTATAADVLVTKTFSSSAGFNATGTMPENGSPTLVIGASISPGHYTGGSVENAKVAVGTATSSASGSSFNVTGGGTVSLPTLVIPVPSGANVIISVTAIAADQAVVASVGGYADGVNATSLAETVGQSGNNSIATGAALALGTAGITLPGVAFSQAYNYTVIYG